MKAAGLVLSRLPLFVLAMFASVYCLLATLPFAHQHLQRAEVLPWLKPLVGGFGWLWAAASIAVFFGAGKCRRLRWWLTVQLGAALVLVIWPALDRLDPAWAMTGVIAAVAPLVWLAVIDLGEPVSWGTADQGGEHRVFAGLLWAGAGAALIFAAAARLRGIDAGPAGAAEVAASHTVLFAGLFLLLSFATGLAHRTQNPVRNEFALTAMVFACAVYYLLRRIAMPALGLDGAKGMLVPATLAVAGSVLLAGTAARLARCGAYAITSGFHTFTAPFRLGLEFGRGTALAAVAVIITGCAAGTALVASFDWNFLLQQLAAAAVWPVAATLCHAVARPSARPAWFYAACTLAALAAYRGLAWTGWSPDALAMDRYAGYDASYRLTRELLAPPVAPAAAGFYQFLGKSTNIGHGVHVAPVEIKLAAHLERRRGFKPHIFIFTIDSLRRDYLAPYNPNVTFTPEIERFSSESGVFHNAFTRYGATGLSEPSIWAGALLLHKQYVTPFAPMNSLQRLLEAEQYRMLVSRDTILETILAPSPPLEELDRGRQNMHYDLCRTLEELQSRLDPSRHTFVYTQPQNLHISVIHRENSVVPRGESYPGFHAPYATRVKRIDGCFGRFITYLKASRLYQSSIIVLTSDHGDALGEDGRWGHAYRLDPEIVRIPLIIHLPDRLRERAGFDPAEVAFSNDITPTLYYLLGHRPVRADPIHGQPLFTEAESERRRDPRRQYLLASSYGAVYGLLSENGRRLFVADGVSYRDVTYDVVRNAPEASSEAFREAARAEIVRQIEEVNRYYGYRPQ